MDNSAVSYYDLFNKDKKLYFLTDGILQTEDCWSFGIHRVILAKDNLYFQAIFCGAKGATDRGVIPGIRGEILNQILHYIYTEIIILNDENISELMIAADYLLVDGLTNKIKQFVEHNVSMDNCLPIYMSASAINYKEICALSYRFIQRHFETVVFKRCSEFVEMSLPCLTEFLQDNNLCISSERQLWLTVVMWVLKDPPIRLSAVPELLSYLKIADIEESLAYDIIHDDIVLKNPSCEELQSIVLQNESAHSLLVLKHFTEHIKLKTFNTSRTSVLSNFDFLSHRNPKQLNLIISHSKNRVKLYITYDENIDMWRELTEIKYSSGHILVIGHNVYIFKGSCKKVFNLLNKQWTDIPDFPRYRGFEEILKHKNNIYALGGYHNVDTSWVSEVNCFIPGRFLWFPVKPMTPVYSLKAVSYQDRILVVSGTKANLHSDPPGVYDYMSAEMYDDECNEWISIASPAILRVGFSLVQYHSKVYIFAGKDSYLNGRNEVETYDFEKDSWEIVTDMETPFDVLEVCVFKDELIAFEGRFFPKTKYTTLFRWNEADKLWELLNMSSEDVSRYSFFTIDNTESVHMLTKENRDPGTRFEKSPFS